MHGCESKKLSASVHQARRERDVVQATRSSPDRRVPYKKVAVSIVWATPLLGGERATTGIRARHFCNQRFRSSDLRKSGKFPILSGSQENVSNRFVAQSVIGICSGTDVSGDRFTYLSVLWKCAFKCNGPSNKCNVDDVCKEPYHNRN